MTFTVRVSPHFKSRAGLQFCACLVFREEVEVPEPKEQEELVTSTVRPEEIPPVPENRFLMRRSPQAVQSSRDAETDARGRDRQRESVCCAKADIETFKRPSFNLFLLFCPQLW